MCTISVCVSVHIAWVASLRGTQRRGTGRVVSEYTAQTRPTAISDPFLPGRRLVSVFFGPFRSIHVKRSEQPVKGYCTVLQNGMQYFQNQVHSKNRQVERYSTAEARSPHIAARAARSSRIAARATRRFRRD